MGAALVEDVGITRVLAFTVPASLLIAFGLETLLDFLGRRFHVRYAIAAVALFGVLSAASLGMFRDALVHGPLWFRDYGLYGMQYGATQLFGEAIPQYLAEHPDSQIMVSPTWANGAENFVRFFLSREQQARVQLLNVDYFMQTRRELTPNMVLVMTPEEYQRAQASGKFKAIDVLRTLPYPDGSPGFYLARLAYVDNLDTIIQQEREARSQPVTETAVIDGQTVEVTHSQFDMGLLPNVFDGDTFTLVRGLEANPLIMEFTFPEPRKITGLAADFASMDFTLTAKLYAEDGRGAEGLRTDLPGAAAGSACGYGLRVRAGRGEEAAAGGAPAQCAARPTHPRAGARLYSVKSREAEPHMASPPELGLHKGNRNTLWFVQA